jgi:demethylmenaquinone methyltransferase/2-methoxy-6-polyprenyl-1,4-benzoquinol methylase
VKPQHDSAADKKEQVAEMFNDISDKYDLLNGVLSLGIDRYWRHRVVRLVKKKKPETILDVATGTGDLAIAMLRTEARRIVGVDISTNMLQVAKKKLSATPQNRVTLQTADGEKLPFENDSFSVVTVAFGVRNFDDRQAGLREMHRVLSPDGTLVVLEFSMPRNAFVGLLYRFYFFKVLPWIGKKVSKNSYAYTYLPQSVKEFPEAKVFAQELLNVGFSQVKTQSLTFGLASIYEAKK